MTFDQLVEFIHSVGSFENLPKHPCKKEWAHIKNEIKPHYFGTIPPALGKAFPNEDDDVWNYRKDNYEAKTESCVVDAVKKLSRLLQDSKYFIKYENEEMQNYIESEKRIMGDRIPSFFLSKFVSKRVLDANGALVVWPKNIGDTSKMIDFDLDFIDSDFIDFIDFDFGVMMYRSPARSKYSTLLSLSVPQEYVTRVVTTDFYGYIGLALEEDGSESKNKDGKSYYRLHSVYQHKLGYLPLVIFGGRALTKNVNGYDFVYYKSDISAAVPFMNSAAVSDNQLQSVIIANACPYKIMDAIECGECGGTGKYKQPTPENPDLIVECKKCQGSGDVVHISALKGIIKRRTGDDNDKNIMPLQFVSPNVDTMKTLAEFAETNYVNLKQQLNIERAVKLAQSGIAKDIDKQDENIDVKFVSDSVFFKLQVILQAINDLVFMNQKGKKVFVIPPASFDIKSEAELYQEFQETIISGAPDFVRATAFTAWVKARFSTDETGQRIAELCLMYAPLYLLTITERETLYMSKTATQDDLIRAAYGLNEIMKMYEADKDSIYNELSVIYAYLDTALTPRFEMAAQNAAPPEILPGQEL